MVSESDWEEVASGLSRASSSDLCLFVHLHIGRAWCDNYSTFESCNASSLPLARVCRVCPSTFVFDLVLLTAVDA
eukprot:4901249-Amphidinium_carterae.1